jgi:GTPase SAR1 family protein
MIGYWQNREHNLFEAIVTSLSMYLSKLPRFCPAPFQRAFQPTGQLLYQMMLPFRQVHFKALDMPLTHRFDENTGIYSRTVKDAVETLWPHRYQGPPEQMAETYLKGTHFLPLFQVLVPYTPFTDEQRFTHHWCLGDTGTGKTTYLRHFIQHDLERAAEGGCSLVVIDSKKLIREGLRTLKIFTEKLDGCMTLVDADTPFPLNPFHLPKPMAIAVISYMLAGLSDASKLQTGVLRWYAEAAYHTGKSLETILEYMRWNGKDPLSDLDRFPDDVRNWFLKTRKGVHSATSSGIEQRLADFLRDNKDKLGRMFAADSWGLDLMQLHEGGRVWLIDTNRHAFGKDGANLLGRLMIALIDNLSSYRTTMNADTLKPLLVVIDEAQDYIEKDEIFADILEKARAQKIGITVAHHFEGQIDQRIQLSLRQGGIKTQCVDAGKPVEIKTRRESFTLSVPPLEFSKRHDLQMTQDDYDKMRELMAFHHPYKPTRTLRVVPDEDIEEPKHYA